jgi:hypothetical protein
VSSDFGDVPVGGAARLYYWPPRLSSGSEAVHDAGMPEPAPQPTPERKPAWRAACLAYRDERRAGVGHHSAWLAAVAALQAVWPLPDSEAGLEATQAIAYASMHHGAWLWEGVGGL